MTDDIAAWLTAIWDEQEKAEGRKFRSRKDVPQPDSIMHGWPEDDLVTIRRPLGDSEVAMTHADYLAEFCVPNPDLFTLARIAADRQILALHTSNDGRCQMCVTDIGVEYGEPVWEFYEHPCSTVRLLALPHAARPGYDEAWRP